MSQQNLSKALKELDVAFQFPIFERSSRGVVPTWKGIEFLTYARNELSFRQFS